MPKRAGLAAQPHDALIKFTFSQRKHATGLLKAALDPAITSLLRWATLELEKIHFVDRSLRGRYADLLFSAEIGDERIYIYVLLEHQREVEPLMIYRMGSYMWRHWEQLVRDEPTRKDLPAIIPVLIHHSATGWTAATAFEDIIAAPEAARAALRPHIPHFEMKLIDVSHGPASGLVKNALTDLGRIVLWCLSVAGNQTRLETEIDQLVAELNALYATPREIDALLAVLRYLGATHPKLGVAKIAKLLKTTARKGQKEVIVDELDEMEHEVRARMLLGQLAARFGRVSSEAKARVRAATPAMLTRWSIRVLTEPTLEAVLGGATAKRAKKHVTPARRPAARRGAAAAR